MRKLRVILLVAALVALVVLMAAEPAAARRLQLLGCDGLLQWPCPGPAL